MYSSTSFGEEQIYVFEKSSLEFISLPEKKIIISKSCRKIINRNSKFECQAYSALSFQQNSILKVMLVAGANPGSQVCEALPKSRITIGKNKYGQQSFCLFPDNSMVSTGSLYYYWKINKRTKN